MQWCNMQRFVVIVCLAATLSGCAKLDPVWAPIDRREYAEQSAERQIAERNAEAKLANDTVLSSP